MEVIEVVFIAINHFLVVATFLTCADDARSYHRRSAPVGSTTRSQRSIRTAISTTIITINASSGVR
jgi:hypothetical protein